MEPDSFENPVNPIPPVIVVLCLLVVGVELVLSLAAAGVIGGRTGVGWRINAINDYAFSPLVLDRLLDSGDTSLNVIRRFVTYPFVHGSFTQSLFGAALLLALGKFVGDVFRSLPTLLIFFGSTVIAAIIYGLIVDGPAPLFSVFTPVYGLIGAYTYIIWLRLGQTGQNQLAAFRLIGFLLGLQLFFGLVFGTDSMWIAELAGFFTGFTLSTVAAPGGWTALVGKLRERS